MFMEFFHMIGKNGLIFCFRVYVTYFTAEQLKGLYL